MSASQTLLVDAVRIVSLPRELATSYDVSAFICSEFGVGPVSSVRIVYMKSTNGTPYRSAFVDMMEPISLEYGGQRTIESKGQYHFENGKVMDHVKIVHSEKSSYNKGVLELEPGQWTSIYVPFVPKDLSSVRGDLRYNTSAALATFFEDELMLGEVSHIELVDGKVRSARVFFRNWFNNRTSLLVRAAINAKHEFLCDGYYDGFEFRKFDNRRYIVLRKNTVEYDSSSSLNEPTTSTIRAVDANNEQVELTIMI
uniref:Uncharacterized protein n=1 Tax=viral metagenome TaxID=1070528 RepID=A0A6C0B6Q7_9ZZZZ